MATKKISSIDKALSEVILEAYRRGFTVQSDFARTHADYIAMAASIGLLSTRLYGNVYSREWRPTIKGLTWLEATAGVALEVTEDMDDGHD